MKGTIVTNVNEQNCKRFLKENPGVHKLLKKEYRGKTLLKRYCKFLEAFNDKKRLELCNYSETVDSPSFGKKTFDKWNWNGVTGWAELFQFVQG